MTSDRRWLVSISLFWLLSAAFFWQPLFRGGILIPTNPRLQQPWAAEEPGWREEGTPTNPLMRDALNLTYPWRVYNSEMLLRGEIPFWNPDIFSGYPHLATLQANALHPLVVVFDLWDPVAGIAWSMALHLALAGTMMFLFLRRLGVGLGAATLGGVLFEFNGFFLVRMSAPSYVFTGIWAPLLFMGVEDLLRRGRWRDSWKIVLSTCLAFLGGHPQIFVLMMLMGFGYALLTAWSLSRESKPAHLVGRFLELGTAVALGLALAAFQLLPFLELVGETAREPVEYASHRKLALPVAALGQAVVPDLFGHPVDRSYWLNTTEQLTGQAPEAERVWSWNYCGENLFTGVAPLVLAVFALYRVRSRESLYFGTLAAVALLALFGAPVVSRTFHDLVPTFEYSRPDRIIYVYMVALSVLAPLGWAGARGWRDDPAPSERASWAGRALLVLPLAPALTGFLFDSGDRAGQRQFLALGIEKIRAQSEALAPQALGALAVAVAVVVLMVLSKRWSRGHAWSLTVVVLLVAGPLFRFGWRFNPVQEEPLFPDNPVITRIERELGDDGRFARLGRVDIQPNIGQTLGFSDVNGASAAALGSYARLVQRADPQAIVMQKYFHTFRDPAVLDGPLPDYLGVEVLLGNDLPLPELAGLPAGLDFSVYRNPDRLPRFFLAQGTKTYSTIDEGLEMFFSSSFEPRRVALLDASEETVLSPLEAPSGEATGESVKVVSYDPHQIELEVETNGERVLASSEIDYPGWEVEIDGERRKKLTVNTAFRGVQVPAGRHHVRFFFVPRSFYLGLGLTLLAGLGYATSLFWTNRSEAR